MFLMDEEALGIVIDSTNIGEYDKRVVLLTAKLGKISAFVKGARRQNSPFLATSNMFCFGTFFLGKGKDSYYVNKVEPIKFFDELRDDYLGAYYGAYFLEYTNYFTSEGLEAKDVIHLLVMALKALSNKELDKELTRMIFEMKMFVYAGEYPEINNCTYCGTPTSNAAFSFERDGTVCRKCYEDKGLGKSLVYLSPTAIYTLKFILSTNPQKLFTFKLRDGVKAELENFIEDFKHNHIDKEFKSLRVLKEVLEI